MNLVLTVAPDAVETALQRYVADPSNGSDPIAIAQHHHVLPLYNDFMGCFGLRPSGECVFVGWDDPTTAQPIVLGLQDFKVIHAARVQGAMRYPEIPGIMPDKPVDARGPSCRGTGRTDCEPQLVCECGGTGWVPWPEEGGLPN